MTGHPRIPLPVCHRSKWSTVLLTTQSVFQHCIYRRTRNRTCLFRLSFLFSLKIRWSYVVNSVVYSTHRHVPFSRARPHFFFFFFKERTKSLSRQERAVVCHMSRLHLMLSQERWHRRQPRLCDPQCIRWTFWCRCLDLILSMASGLHLHFYYGVWMRLWVLCSRRSGFIAG